MEKYPFPSKCMSDIEYSVITSDVIKSFFTFFVCFLFAEKKSLCI